MTDEIPDYRVTAIEKRDRLETKLDRLIDEIVATRIALASLATTDAVRTTARSWGLGLGAIVVAGAVGVAAVLLQSSSNQLAAFQAGLSAVATVAASQPSATAEK
jgi:predicted tellurium resistance membrane protein TerC